MGIGGGGVLGRILLDRMEGFGTVRVGWKRRPCPLPAPDIQAPQHFHPLHYEIKNKKRKDEKMAVFTMT